MNLETRLENLKKQQEMIKEQFIKIAGAIELLEGMVEDEKNNGTKEEPKKSKK